MEAQDSVSDSATKAASSVVQAILMHILMGGPSMSPHARAAELEVFNGTREKTEQFIQAVCIAVTMQLDTFVGKRMKILYVLSFMCRGMAQVWAAKETSVVLANMSTFNTLKGLLTSIKRTFDDPDKERTAR